MSDTKKMKFHVTITDNETGEALYDRDACAVLASINSGDGVIMHESLACNSLDFAFTLNTAQNLVRKVVNEHPEIALLTMCVQAEQREKTEETETKNEE